MTGSPEDRRSIIAPTGAAFSSFDELARKFVIDGEVSSIQDLVGKRDDLLTEILFEWYREGQVACQYARVLALDPQSANWPSLVLRGNFDEKQLTPRVDAFASTADALQLIFVGHTSAKSVVDLVAKLCSTGRWWSVEVPWQSEIPRGQEEFIAVGMRWVPLDRSYTSWVLGVSPLESMPFTRRFVGAPFTALLFRPTPPSARRKKEDPTLRLPASHLAHMKLDVPKELVQSLEAGTRETRQAFLSPNTQDAARARVTVSLPANYRPVLEPLFWKADGGSSDL